MSFVVRITAIRQNIVDALTAIFCPKLLQRKKDRIELNGVLRDHWKGHALSVFELVFEDWDDKTKLGKFIVFIDEEYDVDWISDGSLPEPAARAISFAESVGARRCKHLPTEQILEFKRLIGQSIVSGLRCDSKQSQSLTHEASTFLRARTTERSRAWTLMSAHILLISIVGATIAFQPNIPASSFNLTLTAFTGGVLGAYMSVIQSAGKGKWDAASGFRLHLLEALTRIVAGGLFGLVAYLFSQSIHAPPSLKGSGVDDASIFILGVVAGFIERTIPKMITAYSNESYVNQRNEE